MPLSRSSDALLYTLTGEQIYELAFRAAGVGSGAVMALAPDVVMPSDVIKADLTDLLTDMLAPIPEGYR